ncbi:hypothetical protein [Hymenobacter nivis]|nr:hypothetical protein [Hymenobacter nivis]
MHRPRPRSGASSRSIGFAVLFVVVALVGLRACDKATAPVAPAPAASTAP